MIRLTEMTKIPSANCGMLVRIDNSRRLRFSPAI